MFDSNISDWLELFPETIDIKYDYTHIIFYKVIVVYNHICTGTH